MKVRPLDLQESQDATGDYKHTTKGGKQPTATQATLNSCHFSEQGSSVTSSSTQSRVIQVWIKGFTAVTFQARNLLSWRALGVQVFRDAGGGPKAAQCQ